MTSNLISCLAIGMLAAVASGCGTLQVPPDEPAEDAMFGEEEAYELFMGRWSRRLAPRLVEFAALQPPVGRVLDVGSGTGALAEELGKQFPAATVVGIDPSAPYVQYARQRLPSERFVFDVGDAQRMAYPEDDFDHTLSLLVVNFIPAPERALAEMIRVTRPGGVVAAAVWDYGEGMQMLRHFWDAAIELDPDSDALDERHMPLCRSGELEALWSSGGLEDVVETGLSIDMAFEDFDDFWQPFQGGQGPAGAYVARLEDEARDRLRDAVARRVTGEDGSIRLSGRAWAVRGTVP